MDDYKLEIEHRLTRVEEAVAVIPKMSEQVDTLANKFAKYEGRWGAITLIITAIWAMFSIFKDDLFNWIKGH